jgi:hypothetical protein
MRMRWHLGVGVVLALMVCAGGVWKVAAHDRLSTVTWDREIQPIVEARCLGCHAAGQTAPALTTYEAARPWARAIRHQVITRRMPVWHAARGYGEFANDPSLSPFEISLMVAWVDGGAPRTAAPRPGAPIAAARALVSPPLPAPIERGHEVTIGCDSRAAIRGTLLGLRPRLDSGGSVRVVAIRPDGGRDELGWFRDVDPADSTIYRLRTPLELRTGAQLATEVSGSASCALIATLR